MKKLWRVFELTVQEQRAIIVLLAVYVGYVAYEAHRVTRPQPLTPNESQPSPSPGILP
jgi:hypothetical protein